MQSQADRVREILMSLYDPQEAFEWLFSPQPLLANMDPMTLISSGHIGDVLAVLERIDQGAFI